MSREAQEEDPSDDEWEGESGGVDIEEEEAEAEREIDELEQELSRIQKFVNESLHHSERLPCVAHKVKSTITLVRHCCLLLNVNLFIFFNLVSLPFIITGFLFLCFSRHFTSQNL